MEKVGLTKTQPVAGLFYRCLGVVIGFVILSCFMLKPEQIKSVDWRSALLLTAGGFIASFAAQFTFYHSLKIGEMSRVVPISGSYPLISFLLGIFILGESFTPAKFTGVVLITLGIWVLKAF